MAGVEEFKGGLFLPPPPWRGYPPFPVLLHPGGTFSLFQGVPSPNSYLMNPLCCVGASPPAFVPSTQTMLGPHSVRGLPSWLLRRVARMEGLRCRVEGRLSFFSVIFFRSCPAFLF